MSGKDERYLHLSDDVLIDQLKDGDQLAFAEIYDRYAASLYAHAYNKLRSTTDARDAIQDLFMRIWNKRQSINRDLILSNYLFVALRNNVYNILKHKAIVNSYAEKFTQINLDSGIYSDTRIRERQFSAIIEKEISELPPRMRAVFELRRKRNFSIKEVAIELGISENTVTDQMKKALRILRSRMGLLSFLLFYLNLK